MPTKKGQIELSASGQTLSLPFSLIRRRGLRRLRCSLDFKGNLCVSVPWSCSEDQAWDFVRSKADWISRQWQEVAKEKALGDFLREQGWLSWDGRRVPLRLVYRAGVPAALRVASSSEVVVQVPSFEGGADDGALAEICFGVARRIIPPRVAALGQRCDISFQRVTVRDQSSRWGSCSSSGTVSLNWRLILLPPEVQDYVILHELAHRLQMNHSANFWNEVERFCPDYASSDKFLRVRGNRYMRLGRKES